VISSAILGRYARSLAEIALEEGIEQIVTENLRTYREIFRVVPDLLEAFHAPAVPRETKYRLLTGLMTLHPVHPVASNFLHIILQNNRIRYFQQIANAYEKAVNERKGIVSARVASTNPLSPQELKSLQNRLAEITGKHVDVELHLDADLLGGIVVQVGSTVFDGSIRTQLSKMRQRLMET